MSLKLMVLVMMRTRLFETEIIRKMMMTTMMMMMMTMLMMTTRMRMTVHCCHMKESDYRSLMLFVVVQMDSLKYLKECEKYKSRDTNIRCNH